MQTRVACHRSSFWLWHAPIEHAIINKTLQKKALLIVLTMQTLSALLTATLAAAAFAEPPTEGSSKPTTLPAYTQIMPVSRYEMHFVRIPGTIAPSKSADTVPKQDQEKNNAPTTTEGKKPQAATASPTSPTPSPFPSPAPSPFPSFYLATTEVTWDSLDAFVYRLDLENPDAEVDATTRPSKPYIPPDRGFGHEGFAAISVTYRSSQAFCTWLTEKTGLKFRLATEAEWEHAARAGAADATIPPDQLEDFAWFKDNSKSQTHAAGTRKPNAWGLYDMLGNAGEWVLGRDGKPTLKGGSFRTPREQLSWSLAEKQDPAWNASDPQIPKSKWWLPDAPFVGFRLVIDADPTTGEPAKAAPTQPDNKPK